jgi:ribosomal protein S18 acetylase RimI-like enzyme
MGVTVRPATISDAAGIARVQVGTWRSAYAGIMPTETLDALDVDLATERIRAWFDTIGFDRMVAVDPVAGVVGFVSFGPYRSNQDLADLDPAYGEIPAIYVDSGWQGQGIGRALLDAALDGLRARGLTEVRLWVLAENVPARVFYERCGLASDGERSTFCVSGPGGVPVSLDEMRYSRLIG